MELDCSFLHDRGGGFHEFHHSGALENGRRERTIGVDEQIGDGHFENLLPGVQRAERQIGCFLLLLVHQAGVDAQPASHVAERDALLPAYRGQTMQRALGGQAAVILGVTGGLVMPGLLVAV